MKTLRSLSLKLTLAFVAVSLVGIVLAAVFVGVETKRRFEGFIDSQNREELVGDLADHYRANGDWTGINESVEGPFPEGRRSYFVVDSQGTVIIADEGHALGEQLSSWEFERGETIEVDGEVVGTLVSRPGDFGRPPPRAAFLGPFQRALYVGAAIAGVVALLLGILLTHSITRPIRDLTTATRAIASGDLEKQVEVRSKDELGELARSFNQMSADLARAGTLRRQMTADIAHELRTPLSLILGHSEALSEGVLPPTPETLQIVHDEARRLNRLVEDLHLLSLSEARELHMTFERVSPQALIKRAVTAHRPQAKQESISLEVAADSDLPDVNVDPDRMAQVLDNLLVNAIRVTPSEGSIRLSATRVPDGVLMVVQDSGPGVPPEELPWIFDRFYRGDKSRQRHDGGAGLGLAIARSLVEAHGGRIWAESPPGEGLRVLISLGSGGREGSAAAE